MDVSLWAKEMYYATCIQNMTSYSKCNINTHKTTRLDLFILNANNHNYFLYYLHSLSILFPMRSFISVVHQIYNIHTCFSLKKTLINFPFIKSRVIPILVLKKRWRLLDNSYDEKRTSMACKSGWQICVK